MAERFKKPKGREAAQGLPTVPCSACGDPVKQTRRSVSGQHFCSKAACQRAKARDYYHRVVKMGSDEMLPKQCSHCSDPLPERARRSNDSKLGRWCRKRACQADKRYREETAAIQANQGPRAALMEAAVVADRAECSDCTLVNAIPGFPHKDPYGSACYGTGGGPGTQWHGKIDPAWIDLIWPEREYADEDS